MLLWTFRRAIKQNILDSHVIFDVISVYAGVVVATCTHKLQLPKVLDSSKYVVCT